MGKRKYSFSSVVIGRARNRAGKSVINNNYKQMVLDTNNLLIIINFACVVLGEVCNVQHISNLNKILFSE